MALRLIRGGLNWLICAKKRKDWRSEYSLFHHGFSTRQCHCLFHCMNSTFMIRQIILLCDSTVHSTIYFTVLNQYSFRHSFHHPLHHTKWLWLSPFILRCLILVSQQVILTHSGTGPDQNFPPKLNIPQSLQITWILLANSTSNLNNSTNSS